MEMFDPAVTLTRSRRKTKAIAFQFARIGNDESAKAFLEELDRSETCGKYVSVDSGEFCRAAHARTTATLSDASLEKLVSA
jgi:hypothetical protein